MPKQHTQQNPLVATFEHAISLMGPRDQIQALRAALGAIAPYVPVISETKSTVPDSVVEVPNEDSLEEGGYEYPGDEEDADYDELSEEDAAEIAAIAEELDETDIKLLRGLDKKIEGVAAKDLAHISGVKPSTINNHMVKGQPLKRYGLVTKVGGYLITERGRKVLRLARQQ